MADITKEIKALQAIGSHTKIYLSKETPKKLTPLDWQSLPSALKRQWEGILSWLIKLEFTKPRDFIVYHHHNVGELRWSLAGLHENRRIVVYIDLDILEICIKAYGVGVISPTIFTSLSFTSLWSWMLEIKDG